MVADMVADMGANKVADMGADKVADKIANMVVENVFFFSLARWSWTWWPTMFFLFFG